LIGDNRKEKDCPQIMARNIENGIPVKKNINRNNKEDTIMTGFPIDGKSGFRLISPFL